MNRPLSVLVIDDDPVSATVAAGHLAHVGIESIEVHSVGAAMAILADGPLPDVILSDVMMPDQDGFELCRAVRDDVRLQHLPIVFVTALDDRGARIDALDAGVDDLLVKPVDDVELVARVRSLARLSRSRYELQRRARFDAVLSSVGEGIVVLGVDGTVVKANPAAATLLALEADGRDFLSHLVAIGFDGTDQESGRWLLGGLPHKSILHRPATEHRPDLAVSVRATDLVDAVGRPEGQLVVVRDVTHEHRAARASSLVLSSISHKFRTPVAGIQGGLQLLRRMEPDVMQAKVIGIIESSLERLDVTIMRILEHAEGLGSAEQGAFGVATVLDEADGRATLSALVGEHGEILDRAVVELAQPVAVPAPVIRLALAELVGNARRAATSDHAVEVSVVADRDRLTVTVTDDGEGFPPEDARRVFDAFFQSDRTGQHDGLGLGLPLVRQVVSSVGGEVTADAGPGRRTSFSASIPLMSAA